jgi:molybdopterin adenylyltransferase
MKVGVLTISDRSAAGERADLSGEVICRWVEGHGGQVAARQILPDEQQEIQALLARWCDSGEMDLILTTGGTGFGRRDRTPEATAAVIERAAPGLVEAMRAASLAKTPHAMLSRSVAGIRGQTLIINLPGSPRAVEENLQIIAPALPHAIQLLREDPDSEAGHAHRPKQPHL